MRKIKSLLSTCLGILCFVACFDTITATDDPAIAGPSHKRVRTTGKESSDMTELNKKAILLKSLHVKGDPLILYNAWDAGSAKIIEKSGAKAIGTSSWSVATANGYDDGEKIPLEMILTTIDRITKSVNVPVTLDFEGGYADTLKTLKDNIKSVLMRGIVGINFEDQIVGGTELLSISTQCDRIRAIREAADEFSIPLFINARSDVFFKSNASTHDESLLEEAIKRAKSYAEAGADGFFVPGLRNLEFITRLCSSSPIPVNIMVDDSKLLSSLAELGVARISYGPFSYISLMKTLEETATQVYSKA
jgi:2-methylisocitrate lyase-like PEP mutase family enzyme